MKRMIGTVVLALLVAACATAPVKTSEPVTYAPVVSATPQQPGADPLAARVIALERQQAALDSRLGQVSSKIDAQTAELQALRRELADSSAASARARDAVKEAELAAARAEEAAQKSTKAFELSQVKGGKR